jgi:peptide/nickel transport system substrate-binding protein
VVAGIADMTNPQKPGIAINEYGSLQSAKKVDEYTADITTKDPDPILTDRLVHFPIPAPNWLKNASLEELATHAIGSGPYLLEDYQKGQYLLVKANENYWGPKPSIAEIKLIGRSEQTVRSSMVQTGEADLAFNIAPDTINQMPRTVIEHTQELPMFRINWQHPVMKDIRVRQAIAEAIDVPGMIKALYPNGLAEQANGQLVRPGNVGYDPNLKPYPYNPDEAKKLMQDAGAVGTPVEFTERPGQFAHTAEVGELIANQLTQIGFKTSIRNLESSQSTEALHAVKPGDATPDLQMTSVSSPVLDSTRPFDVYYRCGGISRIGCDAEWDRQYTEAKPLQGEARNKAFQDLWDYAYDKYWYVPLFGLNWLHGSTVKFQWTPRLDDIVLFSEMSLSS